MKHKTKTSIIDCFEASKFNFSPDGTKLVYSNWCPEGICLHVYDFKEKKSEPFLPPPPPGHIINDTDAEWHA